MEKLTLSIGSKQDPLYEVQDQVLNVKRILSPGLGIFDISS